MRKQQAHPRWPVGALFPFSISESTSTLSAATRARSRRAGIGTNSRGSQPKREKTPPGVFSCFLSQAQRTLVVPPAMVSTPITG